MATSQGIGQDTGNRRWSEMRRRQEFDGEERANLLRIVGIAAFYVVELMNYHGLALGGFEMPKVRERPFHLAVTGLAVAWTAMGLMVLLCLRRRFFPAALKFLSTGCDLLLLTAVLAVAEGPRSPLVAAYFVILALAAMRFSTILVRFATAGAIAGYAVLLGYARWYAVRDIHVPRYHELIVVLSLALTGITLGQMTRRARSMVLDFGDRNAAGAGRDG